MMIAAKGEGPAGGMHRFMFAALIVFESGASGMANKVYDISDERPTIRHIGAAQRDITAANASLGAASTCITGFYPMS